MTIRVGILSGIRSGIRSGINPSLGGMANVTKDATSNIFAPANASEWSATMSTAGIATGNPVSLWLLQEAAGSFADSIGSATLTNSALAYQTAVSGWSRKGVSSTDGTTALASHTASLGDIGLTSHMMLAYVTVTSAPAATRDIIALGGSTSNRCAQVTTTPTYQIRPNDASATTTGAANAGTAVRPVILQIDRGNSAARVITNQEVVAQSPYTAPPVGTPLVAIGAVIGTMPAMTVLYATCWQGTAAQMTTSQIRTLLQTLGWAVAW